MKIELHDHCYEETLIIDGQLWEKVEVRKGALMTVVKYILENKPTDHRQILKELLYYVPTTLYESGRTCEDCGHTPDSSYYEIED